MYLHVTHVTKILWTGKVLLIPRNHTFLRYNVYLNIVQGNSDGKKAKND